MREGLKRRIQGEKPQTLTIIKKTKITKNVFNNRINNTQCATSSLSGRPSCTSSRSNRSMYYSAPFRQPVKGWRKNLECNHNNNIHCQEHTEIYKDPYAYDKQSSATEESKKCVQGNFGSLPNTNLPTGSEVRATSGINSRTNRPLIRSGMQPNSAGQQNSGKDFVNPENPKRYSYSYRELINNRRKDTVIKKLATQEPASNSIKTTGYGGNCPVGTRSCASSETVYRLNNDKFKVQGAVSSSSRIDRLKLDTIRGATWCKDPNHNVGPEEERTRCNGVYFAGKPRHEMGPAGSTYTIQRKYTYLFNDGHTEVNYPQENALVRVRGAVSNRRNWGVCCNNDPPNFLM
ncbi:MAG: hypothetical protein CL678_05515 [Bdellovibrionaceae bacterium]|nr:hypothetical protein [Pseudobdellovibrionaceae bacterium]|tara:strand:- start:799 stop:1839 length:1041 start_codon:yes stop_codon:yes gene_type:complete